MSSGFILFQFRVQVNVYDIKSFSNAKKYDDKDAFSLVLLT